MLTRNGILLMAAILGALYLGLADRSIPVRYAFVSKAEAIVGRPLTPMSYAGVARRTARRCAAGVYYC